ncbi:MAG: efflux RND transporter permease subunit [Desulfovibrionaceae bacterium]
MPVEQNGDTRFKGAIAWMASHAVTANLVMCVCLIGGLIMALGIKQEVFPDFIEDQVEVSVAYSGASPEEVEQGIILAIEDAVQGLDGVKEVQSTASEGSGRVVITALDGTDVDELTDDVKNEVDQITTFPDGAEEPEIQAASHSHGVLTIALYGAQGERALRAKAEELRDELLQRSDITQVEMEGVRDYEIHVELSQAQLRRYGLTLSSVGDVIAAAAVDVPGGTVRTQGGDILVRVKERRDWAWEFGNIPLITAAAGSKVLLKDVADVREEFEESHAYAMYNGQSAVRMEVYRMGKQTPGDVARAARDVITTFESTLPDGMGVSIEHDMSDVFLQRAELLLNNAWLGLALVFGLLALFLEIRVAFWVSLGIPVSFLGAFLFLPALGVSINMISMFAFIVALGIVVDDAIVVGENIHALRQQGKGSLEAAIIGAKDMAMPVTFSVLTNVATFFPLLFVPGVPGKIFMAIPLVVITVFMISLLESLLVLPAHMAHTKGFGNGNGWLGRLHKRFQRRFDSFVAWQYTPLLSHALRWRYAVLAGGVALLLVTAAFVASHRIGITLFPKAESDKAYCEAVLPYGSPKPRLEAVRKRLTESLLAVAAKTGGDKELKSHFATISDNTITFSAYLTDADVRPVSTTAFTDQWREETGEIPGLETLTFKADQGGPGSDPAINVELSHRDTEVLNAAGRTLAKELTRFNGVSDIDDGSAKGKQQLDFHMLPAGLSAGLTAESVSSQIRASFQGSKALAQQRGRNEVTVRVQLTKTEREMEQSLDDFILHTPDGGEIPLNEAVQIERTRAYTSINRRQGRRAIEVVAEATPDAQATQVQEALKNDILPRLMASVPGLSWSFQGRQADMSESMQSLYSGLLLALLAVFALLAIPFNSYSQPLIIMSCIPFGVVGAVLGHVIMGYSLGVPSMFGIVALSGVVVNDSLVFIDTVNRRRRAGEGLYKAVLGTGRSRFRPIMLTTLTTFFGVTPMILETSRQARFMIPMAISLGFGILFATCITLVLVPCLYCVLEDLKAFTARVFGRGAAASVPETLHPAMDADGGLPVSGRSVE